MNDRRTFLKGVGASAVGGLSLLAAGTASAAAPPADEYIAADSSNYSDDYRGASEIDWVVVHITDGTWGSAVNWFQDPDADVSAHYVVRNSDGHTAQMVDEQDVAWHAGGFNSNAIGIEHEWHDGQNGISDAAYAASADIVDHVASAYGVPKQYFTDPCAAANASGGIIGHANAPKYGDCGNTSYKSCPQPAWDWDRYMEFVGGSAGDGGDDGGTGGSYSWEYFSNGDQGEDVYTIQYLLEQHGYDLQYHDGIYGSEVETNVESFQSASGLAVDGVVGPNTWDALVVTVAGPNDDPWWATYAAQHSLRYGHGYSISVDGYYGSETEGAIESFQSSAGLAVDGVVGPATWQALVDLT
ncbi:N-acetylmuramoyl-L-alanine amidase [Halomarina rubra]|uniref:N-acetylmuramoyl-L-alanine amidase n=1 Tax=Halomarina rubra TaxID=2071873 RepID=A0ABD6AT66_9EURY|nr:N-acetylmuramoyl-L-alanine amidase [Halomarina rubra]